MKNFRLCSLDECQNKCKELTNCAGIDYTEDKCNDKACRLYPKNDPRKNGGLDSRIYCEHKGKNKGITI